MFEGWSNFFLMAGSSAGALIGLLFVVATLTAGRGPEASALGKHNYTSPIVFHLAAVFLISAVAMAPVVTVARFDWAILAMAAVGAVVSARSFFGIRAMVRPKPHWSDAWCYGGAPLVAYLALGGLAAASLSAVGSEAADITAVAVVLIALLLTCIRNAWDLVTFLAPRAEG